MARRSETVNLDLEMLNDTELVGLCQLQGIQASRAWPRELLIQALSRFESYEFPTVLSKKRSTLSAYLTRYWERIQMQALKKVCPRCELCRDAQVLECYGANRKKIEGRS